MERCAACCEVAKKERERDSDSGITQVVFRKGLWRVSVVRSRALQLPGWGSCRAERDWNSAFCLQLAIAEVLSQGGKVGSGSVLGGQESRKASRCSSWSQSTLVSGIVSAQLKWTSFPVWLGPDSQHDCPPLLPCCATAYL